MSEHFSTVSLLWSFWKAFNGPWRWISTAVWLVSVFPCFLLDACCPSLGGTGTFLHTSSLCLAHAPQPSFFTRSSVFFLAYTRHISSFKCALSPFHWAKSWGKKGTSDVMVQCCCSWGDVNSVIKDERGREAVSLISMLSSRMYIASLTLYFPWELCRGMSTACMKL